MVAFKVIMCTMIVLISIALWILLTNMATYFKEKEKHLVILSGKEINKYPSLSFSESLDATVDLMTLCNTLIDAEISKALQGCAIIKSKYSLQRLDTDLKLISSNVYGALNIEKILQTDLVLDIEYLLQYINNETFLRFINAVQVYNSNLIDID